MLDDTLKAQLAAYLERVQLPFEIVASLDERDASKELLSLLQTIAGLSDKISLRTDGQDARRPSFTLQRQGATGAPNLRFAGIPLGHEFTSLVLALLWTGGHPPKVEQDVIDQIKSLDGDYSFEVFNDDYQQLPLDVVAQRARKSALWLREDVLHLPAPLPAWTRERI